MDDLGAGAAVGVVKGIADDFFVGAGVVDEDVEGAVGGGGEGVVARAEDFIGFVGFEDGFGGFFPGGGVEEIGVVVGGEHAHAVVVVGSGGGVGEEEFAILLEDGGAFVDFVGDAFPWEFGFGEHDAFADDGGRGILFGEVEVGVGFDGGIFFGPEEIVGAVVLEQGGVESELFGVVPVGFDLAFFDPVAFEGIGGVVFEDVDFDVPDIFGIAGGEVHEPFVVDEVNFGGPDVGAHFAGVVFFPDGFDVGGRRVAEVVEGFGAAEFEAVIFGDGAGEVVIAVGVKVDLGIGALHDDGVVEGGFVGGAGGKRK